MAYTRLRYHIVTATKHRSPLITSEVEAVAYAALRNEAKQLNCHISHIGGIEDHIHIIAAVPPTLALSYFVGRIKANSARGINNVFTHLPHFKWQRSFGAFTVNPHDMSGLVNYVLNQKAHHKNGDLWEAFERDN